jgi:nucleotide-binding universal stress UspA family protein
MLRKIKTILFTTNLSETSRAAFNCAVLLATQCGARIIILHVVEKQSTFESHAMALFGKEKWEAMMDKHRKAAEQALIGKINRKETIQSALEEFCHDARIANDQCGYVEKEIVIKEGGIVENILEQAEAYGCELIVMGASRGLLVDTTIGIHIKSVINRASVPVLVIPPGTGEM